MYEYSLSTFSLPRLFSCLFLPNQTPNKRLKQSPTPRLLVFHLLLPFRSQLRRQVAWADQPPAYTGHDSCIPRSPIPSRWPRLAPLGNGVSKGISPSVRIRVCVPPPLGPPLLYLPTYLPTYLSSPGLYPYLSWPKLLLASLASQPTQPTRSHPPPALCLQDWFTALSVGTPPYYLPTYLPTYLGTTCMYVCMYVCMYFVLARLAHRRFARSVWPCFSLLISPLNIISIPPSSSDTIPLVFPSHPLR
ncbi:hypothetical protein LX32DRAFT_43551 [Colletotrichum zoysiae]|uniref:Uncharacterized protein n=1 Tax=Colletotrichum zoysiae TaxID=1216348 RepID=A0AAD9M6M7_9PEZI|nr:hypothetical protein LX32DRAFT_43551 [Colletotrichum zoysiae]